jgi:hypothetical protein
MERVDKNERETPTRTEKETKECHRMPCNSLKRGSDRYFAVIEKATYHP